MVRLSLAATLMAAVGVAQAVRNAPAVLPGAYIVEYEDSQVSVFARHDVAWWKRREVLLKRLRD